MFVIGSVVLYELFGHVRTRVDIWIDPYADPLGAGYQVIRALYAFGRGGVLGTGLGAGLPQVGNVAAIPAIHTDFVFAALAEELGLVGAVAICALYLLIAARGFHIAARAGDEFQALLATGLTLVIVLQAALIIGGNLKLVPLTGITLPFVSYGGSSLLANAIVVGLLLALSDRGLGRVLPPPVRARAPRVRRPAPFPAFVGRSAGRRPEPGMRWSRDRRLARVGVGGTGTGRSGGAPGIGTALVRLSLVIVLIYAGLAAGLGWWQLVQAGPLSADPANPLSQAAERSAPRGTIFDSQGVVVAQTVGGAQARVRAATRTRRWPRSSATRACSSAPRGWRTPGTAS